MKKKFPQNALGYSWNGKCLQRRRCVQLPIVGLAPALRRDSSTRPRSSNQWQRLTKSSQQFLLLSVHRYWFYVTTKVTRSSQAWLFTFYVGSCTQVHVLSGLHRLPYTFLNCLYPLKRISLLGYSHRNLSNRKRMLEKGQNFFSLFCVLKRGFVESCTSVSFLVNYLVYVG
jgi:hypothetical protein